MHARVIFQTDARKGPLVHRYAQPERPFWRKHTTNFWATDARKVWGKPRMRAIYIMDVGNPSNRNVHITYVILIKCHINVIESYT